MYRYGSICLLLLLFSVSAAEEDDAKHANRMADIAASQFLSTYEKFGDRLRIQAGLKACDLSGLARSLNIENTDIIDVLADAYQSLPSNEKLQCDKELCLRDQFALVAINSAVRRAYQLGFTEGIEIIVKEDPEVCDVFTKRANEILSESE